jgi:WD40 repeat protein
MIGKFDGSIELYKKQNKSDIILLCSLFNHQKLITCIKHKKHMSETGSNLIASGSNDHHIVNLDFDKLITDLTADIASNLVFGKFKHKLIGHIERISCLSWSKHESLKTLASASYDGTVQVIYVSII